MKCICRFSVNVILVLALSFFMNCDYSSNPVSGTQKIEYTQGSSTASAFVKIRDARSGSVVRGCVVAIEGIGACTTGVSGIAEFKELRIGNYFLTATYNGYEPISTSLTVYADSGSSTTPRALQSSVEYTINKKGVVCQGKVFFGNGSDLVPVKQASIELHLKGSNFLEPVKTVKTMPDGQFIFDGIPEMTTIALVVNKIRDGVNMYEQDKSSSYTGVYSGDTIKCSPILLKKAANGEFAVIGDNSDSLIDTLPLSITFSESVDTTRFTSDSLNVLDYNGSKILTVKQWKNNASTVELKPFNGKWMTGVKYTIFIGQLRSVSGAIITASEYRYFTISAPGFTGNVSNLKIISPLQPDYATSLVTIQWTPVINVSGYEIYGRTQGESVWKLIQTISGTTDSIRTVTTGASLSSGKFLEIFMLSVVNGKQSDPSKATILKIADIRRPYLTSSTYDTYVSSCNNTSSYNLTRTFPSSILFSEPVDTTQKLLIKVKESSTGYYYGDSLYTLPADSIHSTWYSQTQLQLYAVIPAMKDASYDSIFVDLSNLTDRAGNKLSYTYSDTVSTPILKYYTR